MKVAVFFGANASAEEQGRIKRSVGVVVPPLQDTYFAKMLLPLVVLCSITSSVSWAANFPEVHESAEEHVATKMSRLPREPGLFHGVAFNPPKFDYRSVVQQDSQALRYRKQQAEGRLSPFSAPTVATPSTQQRNFLRVPRKLTSNNYQVNELNQDASASARSFSVQPKLQSEENLKALNDLIGKNPNVQLEGLKHLLQNPSQAKLILPAAPFQVHPQALPLSQPAVDINAAAAASSQEFREVLLDPERSAIDKLQAQLDASARAQAQKAIEEAQRQALEHVEEQHQAIARAQKEAARIAMGKVRAHNEAIEEAYAQKSETSAEDEVQGQVQPSPAESRTHFSPQEFLTLAPVPQEVALVQPHAEALVQEVYQQQFQDVPVQQVYHQQQQVELQETFHGSQQVEVPAQSHFVLEQSHDSQEELQKLAEESKKAYAGDYEELRYASKYAFGYRIRDYHSGNDYGHEEKREGKTAQGRYHVLLPDGRVQNVEYWADPSGYHAKVTYENIAHH